MKKNRISLRGGLLASMVICWMVPIILLVTISTVMLGNSYRQSIQQELDASGKYAINQVRMELETAISDFRDVSYDNVVLSAYTSYQGTQDGVALFHKSNEYLNQSFSRNPNYKAVFISFWDLNVDQPAMIGEDSGGNRIRRIFHTNEAEILESMSDADTQVRFLCMGGELFMAQNLVNRSDLKPYATAVIMFNTQELFRPLNLLGGVRIDLADCPIQIDDEGLLTQVQEPQKPEDEIHFASEVNGHPLSVTATVPEYNPWTENPWAQLAIFSAVLMVLPLLVVMILLFHNHVSKPMNILANANQLVESGQRGYQIYQTAPNQEFEKLYTHFNEMSSELKRQFDQVYLEQQASQKAQIKALQSQINPHFLNNTLEIINWEARIAENDRVSAMIEALSTMLGAALNRDGRSQIPLHEEIGYVDAYLYIIQERLGPGFLVHKDIDKKILDQMIPRLILQPIVENAVEHDITARRGGNLWLRAYKTGTTLVLEVEHDGTMTEEDRDKIQKLLSGDAQEGRSVGLRNVHQRLRLIYGQEGYLQMEETPAKTIRARICLPERVE